MRNFNFSRMHSQAEKRVRDRTAPATAREDSSDVRHVRLKSLRCRGGFLAAFVLAMIAGLIYVTLGIFQPTLIEPVVDMKFCFVPDGRFEMGSPPGERLRNDSEYQHFVKITRGYWMGETEVTQRQWKKLMGNNPSALAPPRGELFPYERSRWKKITGKDLSSYESCIDEFPVENVSWIDAVEFTNRLSQRAGLQSCYKVAGERVSFVGPECSGYRLPTEAEWEYAARAGTRTRFHVGDHLSTDQANFDGTARGFPDDPKGEFRNWTVSAKSFSPNDWGLYGVHGNIAEWCSDLYSYQYERDPATNLAIDPTGPGTGEARVIRGGAWDADVGYCRSAHRSKGWAGGRSSSVGLRLVRTAR